MKFLFDLFPVILFFASFKWSEKNPDSAAGLLAQFTGLNVAPAMAPILIATVVVIVATLAQVAWVHFKHGKVDKMLWFSLALVVAFGGMTLAFQNEAFIKWKPTVLYWGFAAGIGITALLFKKNAIRAALGEQITLPEPIWSRLNFSWLGFFVLMGVLNLYVAYSFSTDIWVDFKLFGGMGLMFLFVIAQGLYLSKYMEEK